MKSGYGAASISARDHAGSSKIVVLEQRVAAMARQLLTYERRETELRRQVAMNNAV